MMRTLVLFVCSLLFLGVSSTVVFNERPTLPLFVWSDDQMFPLKNEQALQTLSDEDITNSLQALLLGNGQKSILNTIQGSPEAVVLFVEPELHTDEISHFGSAYSASSNGGAFSTLKTLIENSKSSLVAPYVSTGFQASFIEAILVRVAGQMTKGSVMVVRDKGAPSLYRLSALSGVQTISVDELKADASVFTNGVPDLIVVSLSKATTPEQFAVHDALIQSMTTLVSTSTSGNYVGMYTANAAGSKFVRTFSNPNGYIEEQAVLFAQHSYLLLDPITNSTNSTVYIRTYFTGPILETFMVVLTLLAMVFIGICNLCSLQVPEQYENPKPQMKM